MTVVLAASCAEGIVLGSDGQATDMAGGNLAVATKSTVNKLFSLGDHIAWGATGSGGIIQRFQHKLGQIDPTNLDARIEELRHTLANAQRELQRQVSAEVIQGFQGQQVPALVLLFAGYTAGRSWILEVTPGGEDTIYDEHYAIGSGGPFAKQAMVAVAHFDLLKRSLNATGRDDELVFGHLVTAKTARSLRAPQALLRGAGGGDTACAVPRPAA